MIPGLLTVLDDITVLLDDVATMSKVATKKTAALIGDDLAVNANVVVGLDPKRELPIVGKIALGSLVNKALLIPLALLLPHRFIGPLLLFGGAFLCYEALHKLLHRKKSSAEKPVSKSPHPFKRSPFPSPLLVVTFSPEQRTAPERLPPSSSPPSSASTPRSTRFSA